MRRFDGPPPEGDGAGELREGLRYEVNDTKPIFRIIFSALVLLAAIAGCDSQEEFVFTGNNTTPVAAIQVNSVLARTVPDQITTFRFTGLDSTGSTLFGRTTRDKAQEILLESVPVAVSTLRIEYLAAGIVVGVGENAVALQQGRTYTLTDPDFDFVFADEPLSVAPSDSTILLNTTQQFTASATLVEGGSVDISPLVQWDSDSSDVASISTAGLASGEDEGSSQITATLALGDFVLSGTTQLTVAPVVTSLQVFPQDSFGSPGAELQYRAVGTFSDGSSQVLTDAVSWSVTDQDSASIAISGDGVATIPAGTSLSQKATVNAEVNGVTDSATLTVNSFLYVTTSIGPDVFMFSRNANDGTLSPLSPPSEGSEGQTQGSIFSPNGRLLFITYPVEEKFGMFTIGDDGVVVPNIDPDTSSNFIELDNGNPVAPTTVLGGAVDPRGRFLYVIDTNGGEVYTFEIEDTGLVTFLRRTPRTGDGYLDASTMKFSADGRFVYLLTRSGELETLAVQDDGNLERVSSLFVSNDSDYFAVTPDGRYIYVNNDSSDLVYGFQVDANGMLSPVINPNTGNNETATPADQARQIAVTNEYLYIRIRGTSLIAMYRIEENGVLTPNPGSGTNTISANTFEMGIDPTGRFLYTTDGDSSRIRRYEIDENGLLGNPADTSVNAPVEVLISP